MPPDYDKIRSENIRGYGKYDHHLEFLGRLYDERTHFIYELLQNAEDAKAVTIRFCLQRDRLVLRHNGRQFSGADVRGICGVGESTKSDDLTKIGKFGIGFKSVYAYTRTPQVHSGDEHFKIEGYVRPSAVPPQAPEHDGETTFVLPFDRDDMPQAQAASEIRKALAELPSETLLFLRNITTIEVSGPGLQPLRLTRTAKPSTHKGRVVRLTEERDDAEVAVATWAIWDRQLRLEEGGQQRVEIAAKLAGDDGQLRFIPVEQSPLVVFFPTAKETSLGVLIQGPYRTTPSRDNIPKDDPHNARLVAETAELLVDVLRDLRDHDLLTVDVLRALPIHPVWFPPGSMFRPIFVRVRDAIREESLLPVDGGGHSSARELKLGRSKPLRRLLDPERLSALWPSGARHRWMHDVVTPDRAPDLHRYAKEELHIEEITPESLLPRLSGSFLTAQPDEWLCALYELLQASPALWRAPRSPGDRSSGPVRTMPIIRLSDGRHVAPFDTQQQRQAWLPGPVESGFPTVKPQLLERKEARDFLKALGLTEPDLVDDVIRHLLPRYGDNVIPDAAVHGQDLQRIFSAIDDARGPDRRKLIDLLKKTSFLRTTDYQGIPRDDGLRTPGAVYESTAPLQRFLSGNPDARFLHPIHHTHLPQLRELGLRPGVQIRRAPGDQNGYVRIRESKGDHVRGLGNFDPETSIDHLAHALDHPVLERSQMIWELLEGSMIRGIVEHSTRAGFDDPSRRDQLSPVGHLVTTRAWLPAPDGGWCRPDQLNLNQLPPSFRRKEDLAQSLGMVMPEIEQASRQLGVDADLLLFLKKNPELVRELLQKDARRRTTAPPLAAEGDHDDDDEDPSLDFREDLRLRFACEATRPAAEAGITDGTVANPGLRRSRLADEIAAAQGAEPPRSQRFRRVPATVWNARDSVTRTFLQEQYGGRCQICAEGFPKRNGAPYFEGLYLVPRRKAAWIDRPGNILGLCATCAAKFQHGSVEADDILDQVERWSPGSQDGRPSLGMTLCGHEVQVRFTEKHLLDLQEMLSAALAPAAVCDDAAGGVGDDLMALLEASLAAVQDRRRESARH